MSSPSSPQSFGRVLARNIDTLVQLRREQDQKKGRQDRVADAITGFTGSMTFVYLHALLFTAWILINSGVLPIVPKFDPSFVILAMAASVEAIFLSTFVLISQNRMMALSDKRAELDLQISLLAEHEVTQVLTLVDAVARKLNVQSELGSEIEDSKRDVDPAEVFDAIEHTGEAA